MKIFLLVCLLFMMTGCQKTAQTETPLENNYDLTFSNRDLDAGYDENQAEIIDLHESITISQEGIYLLRGSLENGSVTIQASENAKIQLILDNVSIQNENGAAIHIVEADKVFITLAKDSVNELTSLITDEDIDGAIFSKSDLCLNGEGKLSIISNAHGIVSKDDLIIGSGTYEITSSFQALSGKDCVKINDGSFVLVSGEDAIQSANTENARGYIYIHDGDFDISSKQDGLQAENFLKIDDAVMKITCMNDQDESSKAIKSNGLMIILDGSYEINSQDDALHAAKNLTIQNGDFVISSEDDGIHSDEDVQIQNGSIQINQSYEGIEGKNVILDGGEIFIVSSDDGINASDPASTSDFDQKEDVRIEINGGMITVDAQGDALDSNGDLIINDATIILNGSTNGGNGTIDSSNSAKINGGVLLACGSSQMAMGFDKDSQQPSILYCLETSYPAGSSITIYDLYQNELAGFTSSKSFSSLNLSIPDFEINQTYMIQINEDKIEVTLSSISTSNAMNQHGMKPNEGFQKPQGPQDREEISKGEGMKPDKRQPS